MLAAIFALSVFFVVMHIGISSSLYIRQKIACSIMGSFGDSVLSMAKNPLFIMVTVGLALRLVLMPLLTYDFDMYHWGLIVSNINSGNNLYDLDGYYYTPVWGYMIGFISSFQELFVDIGDIGIRSTELLPIEELIHRFHTATITSIGFNVVMKIPLILCDLAVGYLIYYLVKDRTGDRKKAYWGFGLWFFCPIVLYMSGVQGMFDTFSALILLLTVIFLYKDKCFLAGAFFAVAVLLKMFPVFCIFVLLAYILVKHNKDGLAKKKIFEAAMGALIMFLVLMFPVILNGDLGNSLLFVSGRVGNPFSTLFIISNGLIALVTALFLGHRMYRTEPDKADSNMFLFVMLTVTVSLLISVTPQYVIVAIPFLILQIFVSDRSYIRCLALMSVSAFIAAFVLNNYSLLTGLSVFTSLISPEWIVSGMEFLETGLGINIVGTLAPLAGILQYIGIALVLAFYLENDIKNKFPALGNIISKLKGKGTKTNES